MKYSGSLYLLNTRYKITTLTVRGQGVTNIVGGIYHYTIPFLNYEL